MASKWWNKVTRLPGATITSGRYSDEEEVILCKNCGRYHVPHGDPHIGATRVIRRQEAMARRFKDAKLVEAKSCFKCVKNTVGVNWAETYLEPAQ